MTAATRKEKKQKEEAYPWKTCASGRHITNLKQSILETFAIYNVNTVFNVQSLPAQSTQIYLNTALVKPHVFFNRALSPT